jgi:hypothetical protein
MIAFSETAGLSARRNAKAMHIAFAASECFPFSKTGGLADVVGALPRALAALGHQVTVFVPKYRQTKLIGAQTLIRSLTIPFDDQYRFCSIVTDGNHAGVSFCFVDYPAFFDREALYGTSSGDYPDNAERFALFSRAVLEASKILGVPDVFHCHDWQAALIPVLLSTQYADDPAFRDVSTVFTIHARHIALADALLGFVHHDRHGIFRSSELPERCSGVFGFHHHSEQEIQSGNPNHRIWFWLGRRVTQPGFHSDWDCQRR